MFIHVHSMPKQLPYLTILVISEQLLQAARGRKGDVITFSHFLLGSLGLLESERANAQMSSWHHAWKQDELSPGQSLVIYVKDSQAYLGSAS